MKITHDNKSFFLEKAIAKNILLVSSVILTLNVYQCVDQKALETIKKMRDIQLGMQREKVIQLLGEPRKVSEYEKDGIFYIVMYYKTPDASDSDTPYVTICKETGLVIEVIDGDHGINDKRIESSNPCSTVTRSVP